MVSTDIALSECRCYLSELSVGLPPDLRLTCLAICNFVSQVPVPVVCIFATPVCFPFLFRGAQHRLEDVATITETTNVIGWIGLKDNKKNEETKEVCLHDKDIFFTVTTEETGFRMDARGFYDLLILHAPDATEWCQYLISLFESCQDLGLTVHSFELNEDEPVPRKHHKTFQASKCILVLLSGDFECNFENTEVLESLRTVLRPPHKVIVLLCGVMDKEDFTQCFEDWPLWTQLSSEDDSDLYVSTVQKILSHGGNQGTSRKSLHTQEDSSSMKTTSKAALPPRIQDSGCDCVTSDTDLEDQPRVCQENLLSIQPERIRCGVKTEIYFIFKCKLDSRVKNEVSFNPRSSPPVRLPAMLQNEYILSVEAPNLPPGSVFVNVYAGNLLLCEAKIIYVNDMEEICHLLKSATNPVEFMCQAFKIIPYNTAMLDKLLTESLRNNIPATGLHLFGIHQIEEEDPSANQRDEELPTLLHFSAKYGLKNLTALLLTCPGALQAYSVQNKDGLFPNQIAEAYGYTDLRNFIDDYVETADMLKSHIKEELMQENTDDSLYESMASLSADILMKCSLHPGSDEDLYESMIGMVPQCDIDDTYITMSQIRDPDEFTNKDTLTAQDSILRKILEGSSELEDHVIEATTKPPIPTHRPPIPVPRPEAQEPASSQRVISQVFENRNRFGNENIYIDSFSGRGASIRVRRDRQQSSVYDPFAGMKTPGQRELITLQAQVKLDIITVDEAVTQFKAWQLNQRRRNDSFKFQQENLEKLRNSIKRRREENKGKKKSSAIPVLDLQITPPIGHRRNERAKAQIGIYQPTCNIIPPSPRAEIVRDAWRTGSTSSTASSSSNRSSTRSTLSISSGVEGDNEDNEAPERPPPRPPRPPKITTQRSTRRSQFTSSGPVYDPPPVPPRGHH
ncbi:phosphoinositide 3-kinase adapter protein 1 [Gastrophryne carolinensis]